MDGTVSGGWEQYVQSPEAVERIRAVAQSLCAVELPPVPLVARGMILPLDRHFFPEDRDRLCTTEVREAVAPLVDDQVAAMTAGFREVLREQQALRSAVEGIEVGDEQIGRAAQRYARRRAVVEG